MEPTEGHILQALLPWGARYPPHPSWDQLAPHRPSGAGSVELGETEESPHGCGPGPPENGHVEAESCAHAHTQPKDRKARENPTKRWRWASD